MYLSILILLLIGSIVSSFLGKKIGVNGSHVVACVSATVTALSVILSHTKAHNPLFALIHWEPWNILWGFTFNCAYPLYAFIICYLMYVLYKYKPTLENIWLYVFAYMEVYFVLCISNIYIRPVINSYILGFGLPLVANLVFLVIINIALSNTMYKLFKLLREEFPPFLEEVISVVVLCLLSPSAGYKLANCLLITHWEETLILRQRYYMRNANYYLRQWKIYDRYSRTLHHIAPIADQAGKGGLRDSFIESGDRFREKADLFEEKGVFFWLQATNLCRASPTYTPAFGNMYGDPNVAPAMDVHGQFGIIYEFPNVPMHPYY